MTRWVSFGEDNGRFVDRGNGEQLEIAFLEMLARDVAVNLNVLGAFMEDVVMSNVDSTTIITIKRVAMGYGASMSAKSHQSQTSSKGCRQKHC